MSWFILQCSPGLELEIEFELLASGHIAKCITRVAVKKHRRYKTKREIVVPLISGYIFLKDTDVAWNAVISTRGVQGVLGVHRGQELFTPHAITDTEMERVCRLAESTPDVGGTPSLQHFFSVGEEVRLKTGPFRGFDGVMVSASRSHAKVTISRGGRQLDVVTSPDQLETR